MARNFVTALCCVLLTCFLFGCFEVANKKDAIHTEVLPRLEKIDTTVTASILPKLESLAVSASASARDVAAIQTHMRDKSTTVITGGSTHMLALAIFTVALVLAFVLIFFLIFAHRKNARRIQRVALAALTTHSAGKK